MSGVGLKCQDQGALFTKGTGSDRDSRLATRDAILFSRNGTAQTQGALPYTPRPSPTQHSPGQLLLLLLFHAYSTVEPRAPHHTNTQSQKETNHAHTQHHRHDTHLTGNFTIPIQYAALIQDIVGHITHDLSHRNPPRASPIRSHTEQ